MEFGSGNRARAKGTLVGLLPDLERMYGSQHTDVAEVRAILAGLGDQ